MADQPSKPRTIPQLKRSLVLAHAAYQRSLTDAGYMHQVRAKQRIRDAEEALAAAEQQAGERNRANHDRAMEQLAAQWKADDEAKAQAALEPIRARYTPEQAEDEARAIEAQNRRVLALQAAQDWQAAFWSALRELERVLGVDVDGTQDLGEATVETLLAPRPCDFCGGRGVPPDEDGSTKCPVCGAGMDPAARKEWPSA